MSYLLILYITLLITLLYVTYPIKLHLFEQLFIWMFFVFFYTSFLSVIVDNTELWVLSEEEVHHWHFILAEIILMPVVILFFLHVNDLLKTNVMRMLSGIGFILIFLAIERLLIFTAIITLRNWTITQSILTWIVILAITYAVHRRFRKLLVKEGIVKL